MARPPGTSKLAKKVLAEIRSRGLLLHHGAEFPSITTLVAGSPVQGSWWAHPKSNLIYWVMQDLDDCPDVAEVKLIGGKATSVHERFWGVLYAIGRAREPWQTKGLTPLARSMLRSTDRGPLRADRVRTRSAEKPGNAARQLEQRLLVQSHEIHTESGKHAKILTSWRDWGRALPTREPIPSPSEARASLESLVEGYAVKLPWRTRGSRSPG